MRTGLALVVSAPSGAGKSTLISMLRQDFPKMEFSISCTTRQPRPNEAEGRDYFFVSPEEFEKMRVSGQFAEWAQVHGNLYGTPLAPVQSQLKNGTDVVFDIDVAGAAQLRASLPDAVFVFIAPPDMPELEKRLRKRGVNDEASLCLRMKDAFTELREAFWYDYLIVNDNLDAAYAQLKALYIAATLTPGRNRQILEKLLEEANRG